MSRRRRQGSDGEDGSFLYRYPLPSSSSSSIAKDNGRAAQFVRHLEYRNKSHCYECGGEGHLSYECPRNQLGPHDRPPHSKKPRRGGGREGGDGPSWQSDDDRWASVVDTRGEEKKAARKTAEKAARKEKMKGYFSDEDAD